MRETQERVVDFVLGHRRLVYFVAGLISIVAAFFASSVSFDSSIEIWFLDDDPDVIAYNEFLERFEADEIVVIGVKAANVFTPQNLKIIHALSEECESAPYVHRVRSLTNTSIPRNVEGSVEIMELFDELPTTQKEAALTKERALKSELLIGNLVDQQGHAAAVLIEMQPEGNTFEAKTELIAALRSIIEKYKRDDIDIRMAGSPHIDDAFERHSKRDYEVFGPLMFVVTFVICWLIYRRLSNALLPIVVVALSTLWTIGLMCALGWKLNIMSSALPPLLLAVGVADTVHILSEYIQVRRTGSSVENAVRTSVLTVLAPCFFTSLTTIAGFLSLLTSSLQPIREFGVLAAIGVGFAFVISITVLPLILHLAKLPPDANRGPSFELLLTRLGRPTRRASFLKLVVFTFLTATALFSITRLEVGANAMNYFKTGDPVRIDTHWVDRNLGGSSSVEILAEAQPSGLKDPEILERIESLSKELAGYPGTSRVITITDYLREIHHAFGAASQALPDSRGLIAQYYLLLEGEDDFPTVVQDDYSTTRITGRVNLSQAEEVLDVLPIIERSIQKQSDEKLRLRLTGYTKLLSNMETYLIDSQIRSVSWAFVIVSCLMFIFLRSIRLGFFAMIPNLVPIVLGIGFMSALSIPLDVGTVMISCIALGIIVDDTIHFLFRLRRSIDEGASLEEGIALTMHESGRPILITSLILMAGFLILIMGAFLPNIYFGTITAFVIACALIADLVFLPAALIVLRPKL